MCVVGMVVVGVEKKGGDVRQQWWKDAQKIDCSVRRDHMRRHAIAQRDQAAVEARGAH